MVFNDNPNFATQHLWSDAIFMKNILNITELETNDILKLSIFSYLYGSQDLTFYCLKKFDEKKNTNAADLFKKLG